VAERRLWPRALLTPFTDRVRLAPADERAYTGIRRQRAAQGLEVVYVGFEPPREATAQDRREPGE
jgi:membrane protein